MTNIIDFGDMTCLKNPGSCFSEVAEAPQARTTAEKIASKIEIPCPHTKNTYKHIKDAYKYIYVYKNTQGGMG